MRRLVMMTCIGVLLGGVGCRSQQAASNMSSSGAAAVPNKQAPVTMEDRVKKIQENPSIPPSTKQQIIAGMRDSAKGKK